MQKRRCHFLLEWCLWCGLVSSSTSSSICRPLKRWCDMCPGMNSYTTYWPKEKLAALIYFTHVIIVVTMYKYVYLSPLYPSTIVIYIYLSTWTLQIYIWLNFAYLYGTKPIRICLIYINFVLMDWQLMWINFFPLLNFFVLMICILLSWAIQPLTSIAIN